MERSRRDRPCCGGGSARNPSDDDDGKEEEEDEEDEEGKGDEDCVAVWSVEVEGLTRGGEDALHKERGRSVGILDSLNMARASYLAVSTYILQVVPCTGGSFLAGNLPYTHFGLNATRVMGTGEVPKAPVHLFTAHTQLHGIIAEEEERLGRAQRAQRAYCT